MSIDEHIGYIDHIQEQKHISFAPHQKDTLP